MPQVEAEVEEKEARLLPAEAEAEAEVEDQEARPLHLLPTTSAETTANAPCTPPPNSLLQVMTDIPRSVLCGMTGNTNSELLIATAAILAPSYKEPAQLHHRASTSKAFLRPRNARM